jgi:hypothetical protein
MFLYRKKNGLFPKIVPKNKKIVKNIPLVLLHIVLLKRKWCKDTVGVQILVQDMPKLALSFLFQSQ